MMKWRKRRGGIDSLCGMYTIESEDYVSGRATSFSLRVNLADGWYAHPEVFVKQADAKVEAERMEEE